LLIGAVTFANLTYPWHLLAFSAALVLGALLATYALTQTRFEPTPFGVYYTPHSPIGLSLAVLFVARLAYRVIEVYAIDTSSNRSFTEFAHSPLTLAAFGLLAGYYLLYMLGLVRWRYRVLRAKREREARRSDV
jgi:hypothetical protein